MKLDNWLKRNLMTDKMFAEELAKVMGVPYFSHRTVETWRQGRSTPRYALLRHIAKVTGGKVKPRDLVIRRVVFKPYKKALR